jgi:hypothetical protein
MNAGRIVGELAKKDFSQEAIMRSIMNHYESIEGRVSL